MADLPSARVQVRAGELARAEIEEVEGPRGFVVVRPHHYIQAILDELDRIHARLSALESVRMPLVTTVAAGTEVVSWPILYNTDKGDLRVRYPDGRDEPAQIVTVPLRVDP